MRKLSFLVLLTVICSFSSRSQYVTIPDANLKASLMVMYSTCFNASGQLDTTNSLITGEQWLDISAGPVSNWDGLQYFDNLSQLSISSSFGSVPDMPYVPVSLKKLNIHDIPTITSLPAMPNWITDLEISYCFNLTAIPPLPASLINLVCRGDYNVTSISPLPASLLSLNFSDGDVLTTLPALPAGLQSLACYNDPLITSLPVLPATLTQLICASCNITSFPATLPPLLTNLRFDNNQVSVLPALPAGLLTLIASRNLLTALPAFPNSLTSIEVGNNNIASIPALPPGLVSLGTSYNPISALPAFPSSLEHLDCVNNQLTGLPALPVSLTFLNCDYNQITSLPSLPVGLTTLHCGGNQLAALPALPPNLQDLLCVSNQLTFLPDFPQTLQMVYCNDNYIRCLPVLPEQGVIQIYMDNRIGCMPNLPTNYSFHVSDTAGVGMEINYSSFGQSHFPLCSVINNVYHCAAFPVMQGKVYNDNNNNGVRDANEPYRANIRISLSNGHFTTTDNNGSYQILADGIGAYTLTCNPPNYYAAAPPSYNYNFTSYDTLIVNDFALQATAIVDSVSISVTPQYWAARLGNPMPYDISYENAGTTTLTPTITFNYPNTQLIYDSSSNAAVVNNGTSLQLNATAMVPGDRGSFTAYFHVNVSATIDDSIHVDGMVTAGSATGTDTAVNEIRGPFDPNDKFATPVLTPEQVTAGKFINYNIRFQNTGNDTAFNVVITDTLSSFLQASSLQVINTSHPCKTTVIGNAVSFEFINIMLPDSNVNELKSHGYVSFKIKPQSSVVLNTDIPNAANIYFDYNLPVLTNTAITKIANLSTVPLKLLSFSVQAKTKNTANVYWSTFNEYNLQNFVIEYSTDGNNYSPTATEIPKGKQYNNYTKEVVLPAARVVYYRLKITDTDGRFYYGPVVTLKMKTEPAGFSFVLNPVKDVLKISIKDAALMNTTARIINTQGLVVQKINLKNETETVNISNLASGTYVLETVSGSSSFIVIK
ncbi:MAG: hypothetical protein QM737_13675 [Ferruginibacter sp.]